jgi:membrane-associated phospholipid phosphatase
MKDISDINDLALRLVAMEHSVGNTAQNGGPTRTSRALAIIHLAAHDAYAQLGVGLRQPLLSGLPPVPTGAKPGVDNGATALSGAARRTLLSLYPAFSSLIMKEFPRPEREMDALLFDHGGKVGSAWIHSREDDQSHLQQLDDRFVFEAGRHQPDPASPGQLAMGRRWGEVTPFVLRDVKKQAPLAPPPTLTSREYATAFDDVYVNGRDSLLHGSAPERRNAAIGVFWGYDGSNLLGPPPRLYNQVVRATKEFQRPSAPYEHAQRIRYLAAINAAMADAGIAAWHWKYTYDLWRPVVAIREADPGWGRTGTGDQNQLRQERGNPFWLPLGAPRSNPSTPVASRTAGANFTPGFPAYPSGHASFGTAAFEVFARLVGRKPEEIRFACRSEEFNGVTTDNSGIARPVWVQDISLRDAIEQNKLSRIYLGVHWSFDVTGGDKIGQAIAAETAALFS